MSLKVYLAGGFYQDDDWRYEIVKGLRDNIPLESWKGEIEKWGSLPKSILDCVDFVGPYPEDWAIIRHREAIKESDLVFLWFSPKYMSDVARIGFELGYAGALEKLIGVGCEEKDKNLLDEIEHTICCASPWCGQPYLATNPTDSFQSFLVSAIDGLDLEKILSFRKSSRSARLICKEKYERSGYVYILRADTGHYKIGRTNNIPNRMKLFSIKLPFKFEIVNHFPCEDMYQSESDLHRVFADYRVNGEWFSLNETQIKLLKSITSGMGGLFIDMNNSYIDDLFIDDGKPWYTEEERWLITH